MKRKNKHDLTEFIKTHLNEDFNVLNDELIPSPPSILDETIASLKKEKKNKKISFSKWAVPIATAIATFVFMLTPPGQAVSEFVYNTEIKWNEDKTKLELKYKGNVNSDPTVIDPTVYDKQTQTFASLESAKAQYPSIDFLVNSEVTPNEIIITGGGPFIRITSKYSYNQSSINTAQMVYYNNTSVNSAVELSGDAVPIEVSFNNNLICALGGYEDGYGYVTAFENNCEYTFVCDNLPKEDFITFVENCYIE